MFDIGQRVVCVNGEFHPRLLGRYNYFPLRGHVYVIRDYRLGICADRPIGTISLYLEGVINPPRKTGRMKLEPGFDSDRFRAVGDVEE